MVHENLLFVPILCFSAPAHAQSCTPNNNSRFSVSGTTLSSGTPLSAGTTRFQADPLDGKPRGGDKACDNLGIGWQLRLSHDFAFAV
jgi:hypothetical protein